MKKVIRAALLVVCFASVAVAANSGAGSTSAARPDVVVGSSMAVHPFVRHAAIQATGTKIFVSTNNQVNIYNPSGKLLGQITGLSNPQGLATDAKANLYVADTGASDVLIYNKPYTKTPTTLNTSGYYPVGVAQFNDGQYVAVTNIFATNGSAGSVSLFENNKLVATVQNSAFYYYYFCAFDKSGNLFVDGKDSSGNTLVGEIPGAAKGKTTLNVLSTNNTIEFPGGVQVNTKNQIAIDDQEGFAVYTYKQPKKGSLGSPVETTPLSGSGDPVSFAFTQNNRDLWSADAANGDSVGEYEYPAGGSPVKTIPVTGVGIAVVPPEIP